MTEAEWLSCDDPRRMLSWVTCAGPSGSAEADLRRFRDRPSERKLRLLAVACCRACMGARPDPRVRAAVDTAERYADGVAARGDLDRAWNASLDAPRSPGAVAAGLVAIAGHLPDRMPSILACLAGAGASGGAALLRDLFGNPFRPVEPEPCHLDGRYCRTHGRDLVRVSPALYRCPDGRAAFRAPLATSAAQGIARRAYAGRDFAALPVLADALEEAGCEERALLGHLRGPGPHVRGCFSLDLILGKS